MRRTLAKTTQALIGTLAAVVLLAVGYGYFFSRTIAMARESLESSSALAAERARSGQLAGLEELLAETEREQGIIAEQFVSASRVVPFIDTVEMLGLASGASLEIADVVREHREAGDALRLVLTAEGSWESVFRLLALAETLPFAATVGDTELFTEEGGGNGARWQARFAVEARLLEEVLPGGSAPEI